MIVVSLRVLGGLCGALALVLLLEWVVPASDGVGQPASPLRLLKGAPKASLQARAVGDWADVVLARPLFSISRRPPRVEAGGQTAANAGAARLSGILIGPLGRRAIFAPEGGGKPLVVAEGGEVNDSTIRSITPDAVYLASGAVLKPSFDKNRVPTAYTPPFQPVMPPNFPTPGFPMQRVMPQPQEGEAAPPPDGQPQPMPMFRGGMAPPRRE